MSEHIAKYVAPLFAHPGGLLQCGWCLQTVSAEWVGAHREMHDSALRNLSELPRIDGDGCAR